MPRRTWSLTEIIAVAERYPREGPASLASILGRGEDSITSQARRLGLRSATRRTRGAATRCSRSETVNPRFFEARSFEVYNVLGILWCWGTVKDRPRSVLRIRCPRLGEPTLRSALSMMGSKHIDQRGSRRILVEIGNSGLVASLVENFGRIPERANPDPDLPRIPEGAIRAFANGLLAAGGQVGHGRIGWTATPKAIDLIRHVISSATSHGPTEVVEVKAKESVTWTGADAVRAVRSWLDSAG